MAALHPSTVNAEVQSFESRWLVYYEKMLTSRVFLRDSTAVSHYPLLLFGGASLRIDHARSMVAIVEADGQTWLAFHAEPTVGVLFKLLREELDRLLLAKIEQPELKLTQLGTTSVSAVLQLLRDEELAMNND